MDDEALRLRPLWPWIVLILLLCTAPYLAAGLLAPPGQRFSGSLVNHDDFSVYLSAMRQGRDGAWLFHFTFGPEPWQPRLMLLPYLLWGKLVRPAAETAVFWFHALRLLCVGAALAALLFWVRQALPGRPQLQKTAWLFITLGGGLGWLANILRPGSGALAPDLTMPEWTGFMALFHTPHFALGLALQAVALGCLLRLLRSARPWRWAALGALAALLDGLTYVYHVPVLGLVVGLFLLAHAVRQRRIPWRTWAQGGPIIAPLLPLLFYYAVSANQDPYFAHYARQEHVIPAPSVPGALVGWGLLALLALAGIRPWLRQRRPLLVPLWLAANWLALYLPLVPYTGRFALGLFVPLATLAAVGLEERLLPWLRHTRFYARFARLTPTPAASLRRVFLAAVVPTTLILSLWTAQGALRATGFPYFLPAAEVAAMIWLGETTTADALVLAAYQSGNYLPRVAPGRVFAGQLDFTTDLPGKLAAIDQFWDSQTPAAARRALLAQWGITHVYEGAFEQALMRGPVAPLGDIVYAQDGIRIWQVQVPEEE